MVFLILLVGAAIIALVLWMAMTGGEQGRRGPARGIERPRQPRPRVSGPDDDPEFLRQLDEKVRKRDDPPAA
ncbi:MAG TPA: hypothetical protein VM367_05280 [Pseudonocardia sp.]|jgi:hypothetical protein|nr:hypothetical protein [Pseudonocardia sp.]